MEMIVPADPVNNTKETPQTFKPYIEHLPGNLDHIISYCKDEHESGGGLKQLILTSNVPPQIDYLPLTEAQLRNSFTLQVGPIPKDRRRKRRHKEKKHKKKKKEKKHKKEKRDKKEKTATTPSTTTVTATAPPPQQTL